jgi:hypothetical protein
MALTNSDALLRKERPLQLGQPEAPPCNQSRASGALSGASISAGNASQPIVTGQLGNVRRTIRFVLGSMQKKSDFTLARPRQLARFLTQ